MEPSLWAMSRQSVVLALVLVALAGCSDSPAPAAPNAPRPRVDRFDSGGAFYWLQRQLQFGERPAGSEASRRLAELLRANLPRGRFQAVPGGLRNVVGRVRGREPGRYVVLGAHYDTKDIPGFVGANDGASGTAVVLQLARELRRHRPRSTVVIVLFDGEESPEGTSTEDFEREGLRGSKVAARAYDDAEAMVLLDFVGDRDLEIPWEANSSRRIWTHLRRAARRVGALRVFPPLPPPSLGAGGVLDDHVPFIDRDVPAIDLIDFDFPCFHRTCDDLSAVSERSLDAVGETVLRLLRTL
jgi:glutaminyl-peptide cyclotransferase